MGTLTDWSRAADGLAEPYHEQQVRQQGGKGGREKSASVGAMLQWRMRGLGAGRRELGRGGC